ncbi:AraC family transcriptional regulator [Methylobacterium sp. P31]
MLSSATLRSELCFGEVTPAVRARATAKAPSPGFVHIEAVQAAQSALVELGADFDSLVAEAGLDPQLFTSCVRFVPFTAIGRFMARAANHTRCPHLGLLVGHRTTLASLGLLGSLMLNCETVGDALRALEAHLCVRDRGGVIGLGVYAETVVLSYAPYEPEAVGAALHSERALAQSTNVLRALCGADWAPLEVLLPRSAPPDTAAYRAFFHAPVRFDQEMAALVIPTTLLMQQIAGAKTDVRRRVEARIRRLEAAQPSTLSDELREYLRTAVTRQRCKAERVARLRLVHRRTLSRRLRAEGTSFRQLADEARFRVAKQLLADTCMSLTQISTALNFSEPAAFTHAFRRWTGMAPSAWRQANRSVGKSDQAREDPYASGRRDRRCDSAFAPRPAPS